jgi:hypothetical protein
MLAFAVKHFCEILKLMQDLCFCDNSRMLFRPISPLNILWHELLKLPFMYGKWTKNSHQHFSKGNFFGLKHYQEKQLHIGQ